MNYSTLMGVLFSLPPFFNLGVPGSSASKSDISDGDLLHSGMVMSSEDFFLSPE
jgi:hypothetical protein